MSENETESGAPAPDLWACVEVFGHRSHWGRVTEVEQFGTKMLRVDVPAEQAGAFVTHFYGGASIFSITPCSEETARRAAERARPRPYTPVSLPSGAAADETEDAQEICMLCGTNGPLPDGCGEKTCPYERPF